MAAKGAAQKKKVVPKAKQRPAYTKNIGKRRKPSGTRLGAEPDANTKPSSLGDSSGMKPLRRKPAP